LTGSEGQIPGGESNKKTVIAYIEGKLTYKSPTNVHIDIGGIAYDVQISLNSYSQVESLDEARLYTQLIVRDDAHTLFGFASEDERDLFGQLISVSGVGPNTARVILSYMDPTEAANAIISDNVAAFKKVKGVGPKTAQRIILDLKDKLVKMGMEALEKQPDTAAGRGAIEDEARRALQALGFQKSVINKQIDKAFKDNPGLAQVEGLIKSVLKQLS